MKFDLFLVLGVIVSLGCDNKPNSYQQSQKACNCDTPISLNCLNDSCGFLEVYNSDSVLVSKNVFVFDTSDSEVEFHWNGLDQNGIPAPCGEYLYKFTLIRNDSITTKCISALKGDVESKTAIGRQSCDSLKFNCTGQYYENSKMARKNDDGSFTEDIGCLCCQ